MQLVIGDGGDGYAAGLFVRREALGANSKVGDHTVCAGVVGC